MQLTLKQLGVTAFALSAMSLAACTRIAPVIEVPVAFTCIGTAPTGLPTTAFALSTTNSLVSFNPSTLALLTGPSAITGLAVGDNIVGMDIRPADGTLLALAKNGTTGNLYTINTATGAATLIPAPVAPAATLILNDSDYGVDWNPVPNALRIVGSGGQNLRLTAITVAGYTVNTDTATTPTTGVVASAYTNNFTNTAATTLYNITNTGNLVRQGDVDATPATPNGGVLTTVGVLGTKAISNEAGFDVDGLSGVALAALNKIGVASSQLFNVNLGTGAATCYGTVPGGIVARDITLPRVQPAVAFGVTAAGNLISFPPNAAGVAMPTVVGAVGGLQAAETIVGMDIRPADGLLYAVTNQSRVYTIPQTAPVTATQQGAAQFNPAANGTAFGVDFNPVPDRIRFISDAEQNLRLIPTTGAVVGGVADTNLNPAGSSAVAAAYTNNFAGAASTTLFVIGTTANNLLRQGDFGGTPVSPNAGTLTAIGALGGVASLDKVVSFDIIGGNGVTSTGAAVGDAIGYATLTKTVGMVSTLNRINLGTGAATVIGDIGGGSQVRALAVKVIR